MSRPEDAPGTDDAPGADDVDLVRSEEEVHVGVREREAGTVRARKRVEHERASETVALDVEHADVERLPADEDDSGEVLTLDDGSLSIPVFEERLVVEKRRVVAERVVVRKRTVVEEQRVEADLAKELVEVVTDPPVSERVKDDRPASRKS